MAIGMLGSNRVPFFSMFKFEQTTHPALATSMVDTFYADAPSCNGLRPLIAN